MVAFHLIRPFWLLALLPLVGILFFLWFHYPLLKSLDEICDQHLLKPLLKSNSLKYRRLALSLLFVSGLFMIVGLTGPSFKRMTLPTYQNIQPRVIVLDMSPAMFLTDLLPNRFARAKFKISDLLHRQKEGQWGLIVYTAEPFVVSPITEDSNTIEALLPSLAENVIPIQGDKLETGLEEAGRLFKQAGFNEGQVLVLTSTPPTPEAINEAKKLTKDGITTSIMPITNHLTNTSYQPFIEAGQGQVLPMNDSRVIDRWLEGQKNSKYQKNINKNITLWQDEGHWFVLGALLFLLPFFRRGLIERITA